MKLFSEFMIQNPGSIFLIDEENRTTYEDFLVLTTSFAKGLVRDVGVISVPNSRDALVAYFGFLAAGVVPLFVDADSGFLGKILHNYRPRYVVSKGNPGGRFSAMRSLDEAILWEAIVPTPKLIRPDLAVLQLTSGSTGSPKTVRLSQQNIESVTMSIGRYMKVGSERRFAANLPFHYIYGLSVVHLAFAFGGSLFITSTPFVQRKFWGKLADNEVTDFSGVPFHYEAIARTGIPETSLKSLQVATQAGGSLSPGLVRHFADYFSHSNIEFFVMYGQAEASPRISYLRTKALNDKEHSVGRAIDIGSVRIDPDTGEVIYRGPNVCLGYASGWEDLTRGDDFGGELHTGDVGMLDHEGFLYIVGRLKRFIKVHGSSVSLDQVEQALREISSNIAVVGSDDNLVVVVERPSNVSPGQVQNLMPSVRISAIGVQEVDKLPRTGSGKINYRVLEEEWLK